MLRRPAHPTTAASCTACGASMARYYCSICHLFDDQPGRHIYHCPFCNFCRQVRSELDERWVRCRPAVDHAAFGLLYHCPACNLCRQVRCCTAAKGGAISCSSCCPPAAPSATPVLGRVTLYGVHVTPTTLLPSFCTPAGPGAGRGFLPLHVLQRVHEPGAVQQAPLR